MPSGSGPGPIGPAPPNVSAYDPLGSPVSFELVAPGTAFSIAELSATPSNWFVSLPAGEVPGYTYPSYTPPGPIGPVPGGLTTVVIVGVAIISVDSITATENSDGTGAVYNLPVDDTHVFLYGSPSYIPVSAIPTPGGVQFLGFVSLELFYDVPDPPVVYVQSVRLTGYRLYVLENNVSGGGGGGGGNALDALNPGFQAQVERSVNYWDDLVEVFLFNRVNLTVESEGARLGFHSRGHIINRVEMEMKASLDNGVKAETIDWTYTLEKIPGTLLPGAGTSTPAQDAAGTGAELPVSAVISSTIPFIGAAGLA